jgi:hypothetical protein
VDASDSDAEINENEASSSSSLAPNPSSSSSSARSALKPIRGALKPIRTATSISGLPRNNGLMKRAKLSALNGGSRFQVSDNSKNYIASFTMIVLCLLFDFTFHFMCSF